MKRTDRAHLIICVYAKRAGLIPLEIQERVLPALFVCQGLCDSCYFVPKYGLKSIEMLCNQIRKLLEGNVEITRKV